MIVALLVLLFAQSAYALDVAAPEIEAPSCWGSPVPPYPGDAGTGVIVGIVSTGIDLDHADFQDENGDTRILFCWDQTLGSSPPPGYGYGTEWDAAEIDAGTATEQDLVGVGTHVAGCALANGRAGHPLHRYVGIAPGASLIVVKSAFLFESRIEDAVEYIFGRAGSTPAVVCVLYGTHKGGHDGTYALDQNLSALTGPGRLLVVPVGDQADSAQHASALVASTTTFNIPTYAPSPAFNEVVEIEGWHETSVSSSLRVTGPLGSTTGWVLPGTSVNLPTTADGGIYAENDVTARKIRIRCYENIPTPPSSGTWTIETTAGRIDFWLTDRVFGGTLESVMFTSNVDQAMTLTSPSTADSAIAVANYVTKTTWISFSGVSAFYPGAPPLGEISESVSLGPRRDGLTRPDVAAPGYGVMASLSNDLVNPPTTQRDRDGVHRISRTSWQAAGIVTGALAVLLEAQPGLTPSGARAILHGDAFADAFTGSVPNNEWGYGKLRLDCDAGTSVPIAPRIALRVTPNPGRQPMIYGSSAEIVGYTLAGRVAFRIVPTDGAARVPSNLSPGIYVVSQGQAKAKLTIVR